MALILPVLGIFAAMVAISTPSAVFAGTLSLSDDSGSATGNNFSQTFTGLSGDLNSIQVRLYSGNPGYAFDNLAATFSGDGYSCGFSYEYFGTDPDFSYLELTPSGCTGTMAATSTYTLHLTSSDQSRQWSQYGSTTSTYSGGAGSQSCWEYGTGTFDCTTLSDLSLWLLYAENTNLYIVSPAEYGTTDTNGFPLGWIIQNDIASSTNTGVVIWATLAPNQTQSAEIAETGLVYLPDTFAYTPNYYQGYAYAKSGSTILATSTIRNFIIEIPTDITTSTAYANCDTEDTNWFGRSFCKAMVFLFSPSQSVINKSLDLKDKIAGVVPFVYVSRIITALDIEQSTTTPLIASSTLAAFSGAFDPLKVFIKAALWLIFGFWIIRTFRHLQV